MSHRPVTVFHGHVVNKLLYSVLGLLLVLAIGAAALLVTLRASLPVLDGTGEIIGLTAPVTVTVDGFGVPTIVAGSRLDAMRALGYVTARDRLFQMDFLRRKSAGRLAEVIGTPALASDLEQRRLGFSPVVDSIVAHLPDEQRAVLEAYADGVNSYLQQADSLPFEFLLLRYRPSPWTTADSLLVVLSMFQALSWTEEEERMRTIMQTVLPSEVYRFLVAQRDPYTRALLEDDASGAPTIPVPVDALAALRRPIDVRQARQAGLVRFTEAAVGSNGWAVNGSKTADGRAILANDMHLDLLVPNIWYRVQLRYEAVEMAGIVLPGVPVVISGTNGAVAWGFTNMEGDFLDLVALDLNPEDPDEYRTPEGWRRFETREEVIKVKDDRDVPLTVRSTIWGPVRPRPLLGRPVAVRWTALEPTAVDIGLVHMDRARSLDDALAVMNRAGAPGSNVLLADASGRIAWTYTGRIPVRRGFDGATSRSWADGRVGWAGFIAPEELPRLVDPPSGFIVNANHRMLGPDYPYVIGHDFANGYRAYRITEQLRAMPKVVEADLLHLQLDTTSHFYRFYQRLALAELTDSAVQGRPLLMEARDVLRAWNGRADADSVGFGLLVRFRKALAGSVFTPYLSSCRAQDEGFFYGGEVDAPLQTLLTEKVQALVPDPDHYDGWAPFILAVLEESARQVKDQYGVGSLADLRWGRMNHVRIAHPLGEALPGLSQVLDMPADELPGCGFCIRMASGTLSASERLVVSPVRGQDGLFHMPGGQSGHPLSRHYRDQQDSWVEGRPLPFLPGPAVHTLRLVPGRKPVSATLQEAA
ncbi:penicillin acylase family protein [Candidatus Nitrospira bockiana]